jgi:TPR repeat protein
MGLLTVLLAVICIGHRLANGSHEVDWADWTRRCAAEDWTARANQGDAEAQFCLGASLIAGNLAHAVDKVPYLGDLPVINRWFFRKESYFLASGLSDETLQQAHSWIDKSAKQGFAPAQSAVRLFDGWLQSRPAASHDKAGLAVP